MIRIVGGKDEKKRITVIVLAVMILAIGSFIAMNFMTKFEIGSADGQMSDKMVIRVDGWDMEYTVSDRKLAVEDFECIELGSSLNEIESTLGEPDGWVGSGMLSPVYVLDDNSAVELIFVNKAIYEDLSAIYLYKEQKESVLKKR